MLGPIRHELDRHHVLSGGDGGRDLGPTEPTQQRGLNAAAVINLKQCENIEINTKSEKQQDTNGVPKLVFVTVFL